MLRTAPNNIQANTSKCSQEHLSCVAINTRENCGLIAQLGFQRKTPHLLNIFSESVYRHQRLTPLVEKCYEKHLKMFSWTPLLCSYKYHRKLKSDCPIRVSEKKLRRWAQMSGEWVSLWRLWKRSALGGTTIINDLGGGLIICPGKI